MLEKLLTARADSMFPTNGAGPDEDVNVYLAHLLGRFLGRNSDRRVGSGSTALFNPPTKANSNRSRSEYYRANGDHRLLHLGLFNRGDNKRRRSELWGMTRPETRLRDLAAGRAYYEAAANLARDRQGTNAGLIAVLDKLAAHFDDYVHVLGVTATRQLGLGATINGAELARLLPPDTTAATRSVAELLQAPPPAEALDSLLDLWLAHQKTPDPATAFRIRNMANRLGVDLKLG